MNFQNIHKSKNVQTMVLVLLSVIVALIIFYLGVVTGYHKAQFGDHLGENFKKNFMGANDGLMGDFDDRALPPGGHGSVGRIISIDLPIIVVADGANVEKSIIISDDTIIRQFKDEIEIGKLKVGKYIVVIGSPNGHGQVDAKLVRVVPSQMESKASTTNQ